MKITDIDSYDISNILQHYINLGYGVENKTGGIKLCWDIKTVDSNIKYEEDTNE